MVDVALYESVFSVMESLLPEFDAFGAVRERTGSILPGIAPTSSYRCRDGSYVLIAGNGDSIFRRLCLAIGRNDLADDEALAHNDGRAARQQWLDDQIEAWTATHTQEDVLATMERADVPASRIYTIRDIVADAHYQARDMIRTIATSGGTLKVPGIVPKLSATPGGFRNRRPGAGTAHARRAARTGLRRLAHRRPQIARRHSTGLGAGAASRPSRRLSDASVAAAIRACERAANPRRARIRRRPPAPPSSPA